MTNRPKFWDELLGKVNEKLTFPKDDQAALNSWHVYKPAYQSEIFLTENGRTILAEAIQFGKEVQTLRFIVLKLMVKIYKGGRLDKRMNYSDRHFFGEILDLELPVGNLADLDNNNYWRRVCIAKCKNKLVLDNAKLTHGFNWKKLGIETKFAELLETTTYSEWPKKNIPAIAFQVSSIVKKLEIRQMKPIADGGVERCVYNERYKIVNFPPKDCHHGNLRYVIGSLVNLQSLSLQFGLEKLVYKYDKRYFDCSYEDIENLANGLKCLENFTTLALTRSRLDDRKCKILFNGIQYCPMVNIDLSYCHLGDNSGRVIGDYLMKTTTLESLELRENYLGPEGIQAIGYGLQNCRSQMEYIGLARNPIMEDGILALGRGFRDRDIISRLDLSCIDIDEKGAFRIAQIVGFHKRLVWLDIACVPLNEDGGVRLIKNLKETQKICYLEYRGCGFTENQERKLRILVERNNYYKNNPLLSKDYYTEEDEDKIEKWLLEIKQPQLVKVFNKKKIRDSYDTKTRKTNFGDTIPDFIPEDQRYIPTNDEILREQIDNKLFEPMEEPILTEQLKEDYMSRTGSVEDREILDDFINNIRIGKLITLESDLFFK